MCVAHSFLISSEVSIWQVDVICVLPPTANGNRNSLERGGKLNSLKNSPHEILLLIFASIILINLLSLKPFLKQIMLKDPLSALFGFSHQIIFPDH